MRTWQFLYWIIAGGFIGFGLIGIDSIGLPFICVGLGMVIYGIIRRGMRDFWAAVFGFGILPALFLLNDIITAPPPCPPQGLMLPPNATSVSCSGISGSYYVILIVFVGIALTGAVWPFVRRLRARN